MGVLCTLAPFAMLQTNLAGVYVTAAVLGPLTPSGNLTIYLNKAPKSVDVAWSVVN